MDEETTDSAPADLDAKQRRALKAKARRLKFVLHVGKNGLTDAVLGQFRDILDAAELVKVRIQSDTADETEAIARQLADAVNAHLVARIGKVAILYKPSSPAESPLAPRKRGG